MIQITDLTFEYEGANSPIFENVNITIDTDWKLGLIGRNGRGKTTFLKLLLGQYSYQGIISKNVEFDYFPFLIKEPEHYTYEIIEGLLPNIEDWKIRKELNLLAVNDDVLYRPFNTLSGGEQIKIMLASLFLKENRFLLIDEPTNHLDKESRKQIQNYLKQKKGFILVSHDRNLLDETVDHILSINKNTIQLTKGNFSTWEENKIRKDSFEIAQNEKLETQIEDLKQAMGRTKKWSNQVEKSKIGDGHIDKGYVGHMAAKMMKTSKAIEKRSQKKIEEKQSLMQDIEKTQELVMKPLTYEKRELIIAKDFQIKYNEKTIFSPISFVLERGDRLAIIGKNGSGKSSILKLICGENISYSGDFKIGSNLKISYVSQSTKNLKGTLKELAKENDLDEGVFKAMLSKLGVLSEEFDKPIESFSEGQKKKVLIAKSISESADVYVWDEPLNFIDILSRIQIEESILKYMPTMIFVEHDENFTSKIATKHITL